MSTNTKFCKLIMVTESNNNKYYIMEWDGISSDFNVKYGRVESTASTARYPIGKWQTQYNSKVKKGYVDITHTVSVTVEEKTEKDEEVKLKKIEDQKVEKFLSLMKQYTDGLVAKTYTVQSKDVTQAQVDEAQKLIDDLQSIDGNNDPTGFNSVLLKLYMIIPRYMSRVQHHLLPYIDIKSTLQQEQDNLDAMSSQVKMDTKKKETKKDKKAVKEAKTLLDLMGIKMKEIKPPAEVDYLIKQLTRNKIDGFFEVIKEKEDVMFDTWMKNQTNAQKRILIHGTKCTSVIPILEQGLKIRPTGNYQFSGKVYGDGNYFSETTVKSLGYTGYDADKILLVYEVHTGNPFVYNGWYNGNSFPLTYKELQKRGFDSTFVAAGNGLLNTEIIAYNEEQCRIKYIIHLK